MIMPTPTSNQMATGREPAGKLLFSIMLQSYNLLPDWPQKFLINPIRKSFLLQNINFNPHFLRLLPYRFYSFEKEKTGP